MITKHKIKNPKDNSLKSGHGVFISFEGVDGSGKSTQARRLAESLGNEAVLLREPTESQFGQIIRKMALSERHRPLLEHRLFIQDREWDLKHNIIPALNSGKIVILDRYIVSNLAYQGALGISLDAIMKDNREFPWPDLIIVLNIDVNTALQRIKNSRKNIEVFEEKNFLSKVNDIINAINLPNVLYIDGKLDEDILAETILDLANEIIEQRSTLLF
ncbi:MAG: dTMP kinase [Deltaproteobacteria bacterium]|jgi:dTMP kinase|nr:dTMP kinase [Deltaproteobacteria bacterium]